MIKKIIEMLEENEMVILWALTILNFILGLGSAKEIDKINKRR